MIKRQEERCFYLAAAIMIDPLGRLLVVRKQGTTKIMLPGGKIAPGETPKATLIREINEELGLSISPDLPQYLNRYQAAAANEPGYMIESNLFAIILQEHQPLTPQAEIAEARWVTYEEALTLDLAPMMRKHVLPLWQSLVETERSTL